MTDTRKPREFWIKVDWITGALRAGAVNFDLHLELNSGSKDLEFHVREVVPIDWEKVWEGIRQWSLPIDELESAKQMQDKIQELVEKQIKGEE